MIINIGTNFFEPHEELIYTSEEVINGHWIVLGSSGSGKTHFIRKMVDEMSKQPGLRIHVLDAHGDITTDPRLTSNCKFSEASEFGVNPFSLNPDADFGGVRKRVNQFISMISRNSGKLGVRQETTLRNLLYDLYKKRGFHHDKPSTWTLTEDKSFPTMADLESFIYEKLKTLVVGSSTKANAALDQLNRLTPNLQKELSKSANNRDIEKIAKLKESAKSSFCSYVDNLMTGTELDAYIRYDSKDVVKSTFNRISALTSSGVFKNNPPLFSKSTPIWRYDLTALSDAEKAFLGEIYLEKIFAACKMRGLCSNNEVHTIVIIDEAQLYISAESDHIINRIFNEARKFGIGIVFATQNYKAFSESIIINSGCKLLLGIDAYHHQEVSRKFGVGEKRLKAIQARKTGLCQIKGHSTYLNNNYHSVVF